MVEVDMVDSDMADREQVLIFDTTLRDGEQAPGASMTKAHKIEIAELLDAMGVDIIEAGFPAASPGDFEAVKAAASQVKNSVVAGLARANRDDINTLWDAIKDAPNPRIHTFIATSPLHMKYKLGLSADDVHDAVVASVSHARQLCENVEWSCEDGTRSDIDFLCRCFESAIRAGATTVNIADTVGYTMPSEFKELITTLRNRVPGMERVRFSVHCHNDLGMGVANSLAAIEAGARQVECTINGIGERAGNASLEEIVMALQVRGDILPYRTGIKTEYLNDISKLVADASGFTVQPNKAVVGANSFAHESGIHQHGVIKNRNTYEIMDPNDVGVDESLLVMGKHSGRHAFRKKLDDLGVPLQEDELNKAFHRFKVFADDQKTVSDEQIVDIVNAAV
jgi:2-isopropylmalate synthase